MTPILLPKLPTSLPGVANDREVGTIRPANDDVLGALAVESGFGGFLVSEKVIDNAVLDRAESGRRREFHGMEDPVRRRHEREAPAAGSDHRTAAISAELSCGAGRRGPGWPWSGLRVRDAPRAPYQDRGACDRTYRAHSRPVADEPPGGSTVRRRRA